MITSHKIQKTYRYGDPGSPVAVLTLASDYEKFDVHGYAIIGSCFTENLGVQLVITSVLKSTAIRYLIMCGRESAHGAGEAFFYLHEYGVARLGTYRKVIGCKSLLPYIDDIPDWAIDEYRDNVILVDMRGVEDIAAIQAKIDECIAEHNKSPATRVPMDTGMPEIDEFTWRKYACIVEAEMKNKLTGKVIK
ncbi:MAG: Tetrahydromethanopterin S-methyltransferase subunit A 1 [Methanocella sp. PtaU1.Bin125]|nr:MAG: Tetrahydromethanopterin S-methyltransferase subunit A 1 [Methanocella sp. PtaU1.Bin125]